MTEMPPGYQPGMDPKAAAKAAKAYAKATRPWYKKKRFIIPIGLVAIIAIATATTGGDSSGDSAAKVDDSSTKKADEKSEKTKTFAVGDTVKLAGTQYTVTAAKTAASVGNEYAKETADGIYVIVDLTIENKKEETKTFDSSNAKLKAGNGKSYATDDDGTIAVTVDGGESLIYADMQPDLPKEGTLVFDVPKDAVKGSALVVSDFWGSGEAKIDLGLK